MNDIASSYHFHRTIPHTHHQATCFVERLKMSGDLTIGKADQDGRPKASSPR